MRLRDATHDVRELTSTRTFKITEDEFVEQLPSLIDNAGLTEYLEERLQFEYVALTQRFTIFPAVSTIVHEGMVGYLLEEIGQQKNNHRDKLRAGGGGSADLIDLVGSIYSAGKGGGDVRVQDYETFPSLVWRSGPEGDISAILHVITEDIHCDLIKEATAANESIRTVIIVSVPCWGAEANVDRTASIYAWQVNENGVPAAIKTGGVFRDDIGDYVQCDFEITVSDMLPPGMFTDATNAMKIKIDLERGCHELCIDEVADVRMCEKLSNERFTPDFSRGGFQINEVMELDA
ncbi:hypothetical protein LTR10_010333 [Elasticomyces elasticus]|nr:hypothetical protein LTR10_010333 [Elasticomyces elasticus]KAK4972237.1 hypothetical protein LTR42_006743 [Elasticomyces elasticus]